MAPMQNSNVEEVVVLKNGVAVNAVKKEDLKLTVTKSSWRDNGKEPIMRFMRTMNSKWADLALEPAHLAFLWPKMIFGLTLLSDKNRWENTTGAWPYDGSHGTCTSLKEAQAAGAAAAAGEKPMCTFDELGAQKADVMLMHGSIFAAVAWLFVFTIQFVAWKKQNMQSFIPQFDQLFFFVVNLVYVVLSIPSVAAGSTWALNIEHGKKYMGLLYIFEFVAMSLTLFQGWANTSIGLELKSFFARAAWSTDAFKTKARNCFLVVYLPCLFLALWGVIFGWCNITDPDLPFYNICTLVTVQSSSKTVLRFLEYMSHGKIYEDAVSTASEEELSELKANLTYAYQTREPSQNCEVCWFSKKTKNNLMESITIVQEKINSSSKV